VQEVEREERKNGKNGKREEQKNLWKEGRGMGEAV